MLDRSKQQDLSVSVAITTFRRPEMVRRAIMSAVKQTVSPLEIIIVEDGPASDLADWCQALDHVCIKYFALGENKGLSGARNAARAKASGAWIAYLDDDDEWLPERLEHQLAALKALDPDLLQSTGVVYCGSVDPIKGNRPEKRKLPLAGGIMKDVIAAHGLHTLSSTFLFQADALESVGGFDETLKSSIDHDIWMALAAADYHVVSVPQVLVITHGDPNRRMIYDGQRRLTGIRAFLTKWQPVFSRWWGQGPSNRFVRRYFAQIGAFVVAEALMRGRIVETVKLASSILNASGTDWPFAVYIISRRCAGEALERLTGHNRLKFWPFAAANSLSV